MTMADSFFRPRRTKQSTICGKMAYEVTWATRLKWTASQRADINHYSTLVLHTSNRGLPGFDLLLERLDLDGFDGIRNCEGDDLGEIVKIKVQATLRLRPNLPRIKELPRLVRNWRPKTTSLHFRDPSEVQNWRPNAAPLHYQEPSEAQQARPTPLEPSVTLTPIANLPGSRRLQTSLPGLGLFMGLNFHIQSVPITIVLPRHLPNPIPQARFRSRCLRRLPTLEPPV